MPTVEAPRPQMRFTHASPTSTGTPQAVGANPIFSAVVGWAGSNNMPCRTAIAAPASVELMNSTVKRLASLFVSSESRTGPSTFTKPGRKRKSCESSRDQLSFGSPSTTIRRLLPLAGKGVASLAIDTDMLGGGPTRSKE